MSAVPPLEISDPFGIGSSTSVGGDVARRSRSGDGCFLLPLSDDVLELMDG